MLRWPTHLAVSESFQNLLIHYRNLIRLLQCSVNIQWTYLTIFSKKSTVKKWLAMLPSRNTSFPSGPLFCWTSSEISLYSTTWWKASNCYILTAFTWTTLSSLIRSNIISTWPNYPFFTCTWIHISQLSSRPRWLKICKDNFQASFFQLFTVIQVSLK